jgi:hypothetical protein
MGQPARATLPLLRFESVVPSGPGEASMTAQGHPRTVFERAIRSRNVVAARELGRLRAPNEKPGYRAPRRFAHARAIRSLRRDLL